MQKLKAFCLLLLLCILLSSVCSCASTEGNQKDEGISVVATLFPQYDFARAILGEKGSAVLLLTPGADSHNFELTPTNIRTINKCDVFVYTGPGMEIWVDSVLESIDSSVEVINLSSYIDAHGAEEHDGHEHSDVDPHLWTNPKYALKMLETIYNSICEKDPANIEYYTANYEKYAATLKTIDEDFRTIANSANNKCLYFSGKFAFSHFVNEYGFSYVAPFNSCSDVQIESISAIKSLIESIKNNNIKYVFYEELSKNSIIDTLVSETGVTPLLLHSAHNVSKEEFEGGASYVSLMQNNVINLRKALIDG